MNPSRREAPQTASSGTSLQSMDDLQALASRARRRPRCTDCNAACGDVMPYLNGKRSPSPTLRRVHDPELIQNGAKNNYGPGTSPDDRPVHRQGDCPRGRRCDRARRRRCRFAIAAPLRDTGARATDEAGRVTSGCTRTCAKTLALFGFADENERAAFLALIGIERGTRRSPSPSLALSSNSSALAIAKRDPRRSRPSPASARRSPNDCCSSYVTSLPRRISAVRSRRHRSSAPARSRRR